MEYLSIRQVAEKWGLSARRINVLCSEGRIEGATKIGSYWAVPADAEKPKDERIRSGKYVKAKMTVTNNGQSYSRATQKEYAGGKK